MIVALLASTLAVQPLLLDALANEVTGVALPLVERTAKPSWFYNTGANPPAAQLRDAHVVSMTFRMNPVSGETSYIGVPISSAGEIWASGVTPVKQTWAVPGVGNVDVLAISFSGSVTDIDVHLGNSTHDPTGDLTTSIVPIYTKYVDGEGEVVHGFPYTFQKVMATEDAGIDTRKTYLNGNLETSELPSSNAESEYAKFGSWKYNGGLFAGTIQTPDRSGVGRTQFLFPELTGLQYVKHVALSLFTMPVIEKGGGQVYIGAYWLRKPFGSPSYPAESEQSWANRLTVAPGALWDGSIPQNDPEQVNFSVNAIWQIDFPLYDEEDPPIPEYSCWQLTRSLVPDQFVEFHDITRLILAKVQEPSAPSGYSWRSFASKEYNAEGLPFPHHDVAPRMWVVKVNEPQ